MKILPPSDLLQKISGIEAGLKENQKAGRLGTLGLLASATQLALGGSHLLGTNGSSHWISQLLIFLGLLVLAASTLLVARARFWLHQSSQPFRYTCSLVQFKAQGKVAQDDFSELPVWMRYDLAEMLNERIGRLSFIEPDEPESEPSEAGTEEHIRISGDFLVRRKADDAWVIEVTPRVQVGGKGFPATLAHPVQFVCAGREQPIEPPSSRLTTSAGKLSANVGKPQTKSVDPAGRLETSAEHRKQGDAETASPSLLASDYERIVERVYFSVASQIYRQIRHDVTRKIALLPTRVLRATAYYYEADDYARSNTLDALDAAQELYESAMQLYDPRLRQLPLHRLQRPYLLFLQRNTTVLRPIRLLGARYWPRLARGEVMAARSEIGYADTLLYRRTLAGMSGHRINSVFEARPVAERAIARLHDVPIDVPGCRDALFDGQVTLALACYQLELLRPAKQSMEIARSLRPSTYDDNARYLYVAGVLEPRARSSIRLLRQAVERQPRFEIAQFELAQRTEMMWRTRPILEDSVAEMIQEEYNRTLTINPGNLRAWGNKAYVYWLLGRLDQAAHAYESGREYKQLQRDATVGALEYGLARVAAEQGRRDAAYRHYLNASSAQLIQGVSDTRWTSAQYYFFDFIGDAMRARYDKYFETAMAELAAETSGSTGSPSDVRVSEIVLSFVHNDCGEAHHTYHIRSGAPAALTAAKEHYKNAKRLNPEAMLPHYNLYLLHRYRGKDTEAKEELEQLLALEPNWPDGILAWVATHAEAANEAASFSLLSRTLDPDDNAKPQSKQRGHFLGRGGKRAIPACPAAMLPKQATELAYQVANDRETVKSLRALLPHEWLWQSQNHDKVLFDWRAASRRDHQRTMRWERELDDLHVRALFLWVLVNLLLEPEEQRRAAAVSIGERQNGYRHARRLQADHRAFLERIRTHLWPGNFMVLLTSCKLDPTIDVRADIAEAMHWWLNTDPTAYWALRLLTTDFYDWRGERLTLFPEDLRRDYLQAAQVRLPAQSYLGKWVRQQLHQLGDVAVPVPVG